MDDREQSGAVGDERPVATWPTVDRNRDTPHQEHAQDHRDQDHRDQDVRNRDERDPWSTPDSSAGVVDGTAGPDPVTEPFAAVGSGAAGRPDVGGPGPGSPSAMGSWTFVDAMVGLGAVLLISAVVGAGVRIAVGSGLSQGPWLPLLGLLPVWIGLLGTTVWACRRHGSGSLVTDLGLRLRWSDLAVGVGMAIVGRIVAGLVAVLVVGVTRERPESNLQDLVTPGLGQTGWLIVYTVAIAVIGPIIEEIFFRGLALRSALASLSRSRRPRFATPAARQRYAALLTAALFAALHLPEVTSVTMLLVLIPSLYFFGWLVARWTMNSGRLGGAIVAHIGFNAVAAFALLWSGLGR